MREIWYVTPFLLWPEDPLADFKRELKRAGITCRDLNQTELAQIPGSDDIPLLCGVALLGDPSDHAAHVAAKLVDRFYNYIEIVEGLNNE